MNRQRRALVTGGAGFIGSHLVERLLDDGHTVVVLDNFSTGRTENLAQVRGNACLEVHRIDVADFEAIRPLLRDAEWVFHLAALADIVPSIRQPLDYLRSNVQATASILEAARWAGVERFIYAASSSCYGIPDKVPTPETAEIRPMYPYALTKYLGEQLVMHWAKTYRIPCVSLRLFNVFGPRARTSGAYGAVFGVFLAQKLAGKPLTVVGDGTQTRDFAFVTDVVEAFITTAASDVIGEVFNVGSGSTYSVNDLVELIGGDVVQLPKRPGEPDCTHADIGKIRRVLDWQPKVRFEDGVRIMLENIEHWRDAPVWDERSIADATRDWFTYLGEASRPSVQSGR
jgi:UDP-glucose 4-epimerase